MKRFLLAAAAALTLLIVSGCAHYGALDEDFGKSYARAKEGQILRPEASKNLAPVTGLAGPAAEKVMENYVNSFAKDCDKPATKGAPQALTPPAGMGTGHDGYAK